MSCKRRADKDLNRDNWDEEDEPEDSGTFQIASQDVLKNRVIKTAKRRVTNGAPNSERPSIFSGFTGFGSNINDKKSSFSFVSNLKGTDTVNTVKEVNKNGPAFSETNAVFKPSIFASSVSSIPTVDTVKSTQPSFSMKYDPSTTKTNAAGDLNSSDKLNSLSNKLKSVSNEESNAGSKNDDVAETPDEVFLKKLRSLNLLCTEWIIKHLNENLSYILTPIFDDYKKHLTQLRKERESSSSSKKARVESYQPETSRKLPSFVGPQYCEETTPKIFNGTGSYKEENWLSEVKFPSALPQEKTDVFKFFDKAKDDNNLKAGHSDHKLEFKFNASNEIKPTNGNADPSPAPFFSFQPKEPCTTNPLFGQSSITNPLLSQSSIANPLLSQSSIANPLLSQSSSTKPNETTENDDDNPPIVEDVTVKEDGSVYDKKCKIFIKKSGKFIDHGVGFLFLKLVGDEKKCQLIVRANNKLANIIINVLLTSSIPVQKMGKNNVMIICCPTPETKQPTSILVKVKTPEDADELLSSLEKYRQ